MQAFGNDAALLDERERIRLEVLYGRGSRWMPSD